MLNKINVKNGKVLINQFLKSQFDLDYKNFRNNEILLQIQYGSYLLDVRYKHNEMFNVFITKSEEKNLPVVKQEVGDYESLEYVLKNYIDLLASFKETQFGLIKNKNR